MKGKSGGIPEPQGHDMRSSEARFFQGWGAMALMGILALFGSGWGSRPAVAQCNNYENFMHWTYDHDLTGYTEKNLAVSGDHAYISCEDPTGQARLLVLDIANPRRAQLVAELTLPLDVSVECDIAVEDSLLALTNSTAPYGIQMVDISDPTNPQLGGFAPFSYQVRGDHCALSGQVAYAVGMLYYHAFDVSDPMNPVLIVGSSGPMYMPTDFAVSGALAFLTNSQGLSTFDLSDPESPQLLGTAEIDPGTATSLAMAGSLVFVVTDSSSPAYETFFAIDVSDPSLPVILDGLALGQLVTVAAGGDFVYVTEEYTPWVTVIDASAPNDLQVLGQANIGWDSFSGLAITEMVVSGASAYMVHGFYPAMQTYSLGSPCGPEPVANLATPGTAEAVIVRENLAYVADGSGGLQIIDVTDPLNPFSSGALATAGYAHDLVLSGDLAYVADGEQGLRIIDIANPTAPQSLGSTLTAFSARAVAFGDSVVYVADADSGFTVVDVKIPQSPAVIGRRLTGGLATDVVAVGPHAFVANGHGGLTAIEVSDPDNPWIVGGVKAATVNDARSLAVEGSLAYVAGGDSTLSVVDISDPTGMTVLGDAGTQDTASSVFVAGDFAYVGDSAAGMKVIGVQTPDQPYVAGNLSMTSAPHGIFAEEFYTFIAAGDGGLQVAPSQCGFAEFAYASFSASADMAFLPVEIAFTDQSSGYITAYDWDFGDGTPHSIAVNPTHTYNSVGEFTVNLVVSGPANSDFFTRVVDIRSEAPLITGVADVPEDQGGAVYVNFTRSGYDDDELILPEPGLGKGAGELYTIQRLDGGQWVSVATSGAFGQKTYKVLALTQGDGAELWTTPFRVIGQMTEGNWASPTVTGFSEDNIAPGVPLNLEWIDYGRLSWDPVTDPDIAYYQVYRSFSGQFADAQPVLATVANEAEISLEDPAAYFVTAVDDAGLESAASLASAVADVLPAVKRVWLGAATPNPFNPRTTLSFTLPRSMDVRMAIYDLGGRKIKTVLHGPCNAGRHEVIWSGDDQNGRAVPSGAYFVRMETPDSVLIRRMVLIR